jgi:hypothetical protein
MITQEEYNVAKQIQRELYYKVNILNHSMQIVDEISDVVTNGSFSIDATSDIRRTGTLTIVPNDNSYFKLDKGTRFWADKYIQPYIGIKDKNTNEIVYTNMGIYLINNPNQIYNSTNKAITIQLVDLMAKITGLRNGYLDGVTYQIPRGSNIRSAIIAVLNECGFTRYSIEIKDEDYQTTQNEISVDAGNTYYEILQQLNEFNINYQMYFDIDGVFHYNKIPDGNNEQIIVNDDLWKDVYIGHELPTDYESIKNKIIVLGMTHDVSYYSTTTIYSSGTFNLTVADVTELQDGMVVGFTPLQSANGFKINLNSLGAYNVVDDLGKTPKVEANTYYVVYWDSSQSKWIFEGHVTAYGEAQENNIDSPYYVGGTLGIIQITLKDGEYDNIPSDNLAYQRAQWELYTRCRLQDSLSLTCVPIYWLDVNWVISITLPTESEPRKYLIKQISTEGTFSSTQKVTLMRYYPFYEN